jgi:hypothetical protein
MTAKGKLVLILCGLSALGVASAAVASSGKGGSARTAAIKSVAFHGNMGAPVIDIHGRGFTPRPAPSPPKPPEPPYASTYLQGGAGCTTTKPPVGFDYGTRLYIATPGLSAGRYRPNLLPRHELDCVGLVIERYTTTRVTYKLGSDYTAHHYQIAEGDPYQVAVNSLHFHGRVHYTH